MFVAKYWLFFSKQTLKKKKIKLQHSLSYIGVGHWKKKIIIRQLPKQSCFMGISMQINSLGYHWNCKLSDSTALRHPY